jgi:predicted permease
MLDIINLALPYFGLIFIGFACGKYKQIPETALAWMDFFIVYVALPALFYGILANTPFEQLAQPNFIVATTLATFAAFVVSFAVAYAMRERIGEATIGALAGSYGNVGYMGPGIALATVGTQAAVPIALIFCFDTLLLFSLVPFLMALRSREPIGFLGAAGQVARRIVLNPLVIATAVGVLSAALHFRPPVALERLLQFLQGAAAPCALFTLGVTVALRPLQRVPWEVPILVFIKLLVHPVVLFFFISLMGVSDPVWVGTALLMASLPPALNVFVFARHYDRWIEPASSSVLLGTLVSVATLTTVMWMVKTGHVPPLWFR